MYRRGLVDIWKENILEDLKEGLLEYKIAEEFLVNIRKEFGEEDKESVKMAELRRLEQGNKIIRNLSRNLGEQQGIVNTKKDC